MTPQRKNRIDLPHRCIRTRGLAAAIEALRQIGPQASLERVAHIAGCPKASLMRVFLSKEELFLLALQELDRLGMEALRTEARRAGGGRAGALAAASLASHMSMDTAFRGCPLNAAGAHLLNHPWAEPIVRAHKEAAVAFYHQLLLADMDSQESLKRAQAICIVSDGIHIIASAGLGTYCHDAALFALRMLIEAPDKNSSSFIATHLEPEVRPS